MTPEDAIREALEQALRRFTGRTNTEVAREEVTAMLAAYVAATLKPAIEVDFSSDTAHTAYRSLSGTVHVRYPSADDTLIAWANAGLLVNPEALGLTLYEVDGKLAWRWLGSPRP